MGIDIGRPAVFLDRDGVINAAVVVDGRPYPPASVDEFRLLPGVVEAIGRLRSAGFWVGVVTNQPDLARGRQAWATVQAIHDALRRQVTVDDIRVCPHDDADECPCRKPRPGLLQAAAAEFGLALSRSVMVGDRWRDIEAGRRAGCATVLVECHYAERRPDPPDVVVASLPEAAEWILSVFIKETR